MSRKGWMLVGTVATLAGLGCVGLGVVWFWVEGRQEPAMPRHRIGVAWPGASPAEVDDSACTPLVRRLLTERGVTRAVGVASAGHCAVELSFEGDASVLGPVTEDVLAGVPGPEPALISRVHTGRAIDFVVTGDAPFAELSRVHRELVVPTLEGIEGVASVHTCGASNDELSIHLDPMRAAALGVSHVEVATQVREHLLSDPGGSVRVGGAEVLVRTRDRAGPTVDSLGNVVVRQDPTGLPVRLSDLARVEEGVAVAGCVALYDDRRVVAGRVRLSPEADVEAAAAEVGALRPAPGFTMQAVARGGTVQLALPQGTTTETLHEVARAAESAVGRPYPLLLRLVERGTDPLADDAFASLGHPSVLVHIPDGDVSPAPLGAIPGAAVVRSRGDLILWLIGPDRQRLVEASDLLARDIEALLGTLSVGIHGTDRTHELRLRVNRDGAARAGVDAASIADAIRAATVGIEVARGVRLYAGDGDAEAASLEQLIVASGDVGQVPLRAVATLEMESQPVALLSFGGEPAVALRVAVSDGERTAVRAAVEGLELEEGLRLVIE